MRLVSELRKATLNRDLTIASDGWIHLVPKGEFPGRLMGAQGEAAAIVQVIDDESLNRIMGAFTEEAAKSGFKGLLLDQEHFSHDVNKSSEACAWIMKLENRADGIWGFPEWTDLGTGLIAGKRYKGLSPALDLESIAGRRFRPVMLMDAGLTNAPKLPLTPIMNRDGGATEETGMEKLAEMLRTRLGLDTTADETALMAAVTKALDDATAAKAEVATNRTAALNRDADAFVEKNKDRLTDHAAARKLFVDNRAAAEALIALVKPVAATRTLNRQDGQPPAKGPTEAEDTDEKRAKALNRAAREYRTSHPNATHGEAWEAAKEAVEQG